MLYLTSEELWKHLQRQQTVKQPRSLFRLRFREWQVLQSVSERDHNKQSKKSRMNLT